MSENQLRTLELNESLVREINYGVYSTFTSMFGLKPAVGQFVLESKPVRTGDVSGIVGMTQVRAEGTLVLSFPKETIFTILSQMYGREFTEIDRSVQQGVGELTNIIFGVMKANLNKAGYVFKMAIPSVVIGKDHSIQVPNACQTLWVPFKTDAGDFSIAIHLHGGANSNSEVA